MTRGPYWPLFAASVLCWAVMAALMLMLTPVPMHICGAPLQWDALLGRGGPPTGRGGPLWSGPWPKLSYGIAMLGAMMLPLVAHNLATVRSQSLESRRWRAVVLFGLGYGVMWVAAFTGLATLSALLTTVVHSGLAALTAALGLGLIWQGTPMKALALRGCHRTPALPVFGIRAELGSLRYGLSSGAWCVATCWLWMLAPFAWAAAHLPTMLAAFTIMLVERYSRPPPVRAELCLVGVGATVLAGAAGLTALGG